LELKKTDVLRKESILNLKQSETQVDVKQQLQTVYVELKRQLDEYLRKTWADAQTQVYLETGEQFV